MKFKGYYIFLCVLFAAILVCSTTAVADKSKDDQVEITAKEPDQNAGRCRFGCCGWRGPYGCTRCCRANEEVKETNDDEAEDAKEPEQFGRRCRFGCCSRGRFGCLRCCRAAGEETQETNYEAATDVKEPEQFGRRCRFGCCSRGPYGCVRCCRTEQEYKETNGAAAGDGNKVAGTSTVSP